MVQGRFAGQTIECGEYKLTDTGVRAGEKKTGSWSVSGGERDIQQMRRVSMALTKLALCPNLQIVVSINLGNNMGRKYVP